MRRFFLFGLILLLFCCSDTLGQKSEIQVAEGVVLFEGDTVNRLDNNDRRQGKWVSYWVKSYYKKASKGVLLCAKNYHDSCSRQLTDSNYRLQYELKGFLNYKDGVAIGIGEDYPTDSSKIITTYTSGEITSCFEYIYYESGALESKGELNYVAFVDTSYYGPGDNIPDIIKSLLPVKHGLWEYYSVDGEMIKTERFKDGRLLENK